MASAAKSLAGLAAAAFALAAVYVAVSSRSGGPDGAAPAPAAIAETAKPAKVALPPLCMSDAELTAYLKDAALGPITYGAAQCGGRFPDLQAEADATIAALKTAQGATLTAVDAASIEPFTRSFAAEAEKRRDARLATEQDADFRRIRAYSRDECKSHLAAIEGFTKLSGAELDNVLSAIARQSWEAQRVTVPPCG